MVRLRPDTTIVIFGNEDLRLAKRKKPDPSLFDAMDNSPAPASAGRDSAIRSALLGGNGGGTDDQIALHEAAQARYLNYALSVITSRALPDVRDGLKPVQRRILYTMWQQNLTADAKHRKCAKVVGDVMGSYHPHGDAALYETLVRMAQPFSLRYPLVDGSGNFGSLDGDSAAAMRYTECRLARLSDEMLSEIEQTTVHFRPNYDGTKTEPVVLPARLPNLLVNGTTGIAVGMATNIPPHNLGEVCAALAKLLDNEDISVAQLCRSIKGPDFPTGGQILNSTEELREIYKTGSGSIRLRGTWDIGPETRATKTIYIESIPYTVNKAQLVERIADVVLSRKLPQLVDVKDLSTEDVRIALEMKKDADEKMVMAYLFKHTPLQINFAVNMTCLIPTENPEVGRPERLDLKQILWHFLHFRLEVVTRRLEHELAALKKRIHILEGFEKVFDALDEIIRIIRKSDGKADAAERIMKRFDLDADQTDAILELKIYRLARLEILIIRNELEEKRKRARQINALLKDEDSRWKLVRSELEEIQQQYGDKRRTVIASDTGEPEYSADDFIIEEDNVVIVSRDGWVKRQKEVKDLTTTRLREGDSVLAAFAGSTRATCVFFSNFGVAYTSRIIEVPASTGYGEPIQKQFKLRDGEKIIAAISLDPRAVGDINTRKEGQPPPVHAVSVTSDGYALRFSLEPFVEVSTRAGRRYGRPAEGAEAVGVARITGKETLIAATAEARGLLCRADEVNYLAGPGKGVILIKLDDDDRVLGFIASTGDRDLLTVETTRGGEQTISTAKYDVTGRGGKGRELLQRGGFARVVWPSPDAPAPLPAVE
jgi:DNA gyrase subunit A